jgi:DNA-directed RNA polymerase subunit RPC12/RpoP
MIWECPVCGGKLTQQSKCSFCGAELVPQPDGTTLKVKNENPCPKCGSINDSASWFCVNCGSLLTEKLDILKNLQKKIRFEQERVKNDFLPQWMKDKISCEEYIYYCISFGNNDFYAITDEKLIKSKKGQYQEIKLNDIVSLDQMKFIPKILSPIGYFIVNTYSGPVKFDDFKAMDAKSMGTFYGWIQNAVKLNDLKKKDPRALILRLDLSMS